MSADRFLSERHIVLPVRVAPWVLRLSAPAWEQYLRTLRRDGRVPDPEVLAWFVALGDLVGDARPPAPLERARMISVRDAAGVLGVSTRRVTTMCQAGQLRAERPFDGRAWRIDEDSVREWIEFRRAA